MLASQNHLRLLEAESIHVIREVAAECTYPVLLYSIGKDSTVLLHLARKAFHPAPLPFPLLHIDTGWKFRDMYAMRDRVAAEPDIRLIVHRNPDAEQKGVNPFDHGSQVHTDTWKTAGLKQALDCHGFDAAFGGARRDEEMSRAKERVLSLRRARHHWDPHDQRPELWHVFNTRKAPGETLRVFPLSNWTELDVWEYIAREQLSVVPLYFAMQRPTIVRNGHWLVVDDHRMPLAEDEVVEPRCVRFRTLGCYPLTAAIDSHAETVEQIIAELRQARTSERGGRLIDYDAAGSMELKKQEGYF